MSLARKAAILIGAALPLLAAPPLTTIRDTIYKADGTGFNGTAVISWAPFDATDNSKIGLQSLTVPIINGAIRVQLVPNTDAIPVNYYTVRYSSDGRQQFIETWAVPPSSAALRIKDVCVAVYSSSSSGGGVVQPPSQNPIPESSVVGLLTDLSIRPVRGPSYLTGRTAMIDDHGAIAAVEGTLSDCVRVDGTAGPCADPALIPGFVDSETPGGLVDGTNATFTLAGAPDPLVSLSLSRNGVAQLAGSDYTVQPDGSLLFVSAAIPQPGDVLRASYRTGAADFSTLLAAPQTIRTPTVKILCSGSGAGTTSVNPVVLASCAIPAKTLLPGDRVEVRFAFAQDAAGSFVFQVNWGSTTMVRRTAASDDRIVTGRGDAAIGADGSTLDVQTWGTVLPLGSSVTASADSLDAGFDIQFQGAMTAPGTGTLTLQNYTVLHYPAQ